MQNNSQGSRGKGNISTLSFGNNVFELKKNTLRSITLIKVVDLHLNLNLLSISQGQIFFLVIYVSLTSAHTSTCHLSRAK